MPGTSPASTAEGSLALVTFFHASAPAPAPAPTQDHLGVSAERRE